MIKQIKIYESTPRNTVDVETEWNYSDLRSHFASELECQLRCEMHEYYTEVYPESGSPEDLCREANEAKFTMLEFDAYKEKAKAQIEYLGEILTATIE